MRGASEGHAPSRHELRLQDGRGASVTDEVQVRVGPVVVRLATGSQPAAHRVRAHVTDFLTDGATEDAVLQLHVRSPGASRRGRYGTARGEVAVEVYGCGDVDVVSVALRTTARSLARRLKQGAAWPDSRFRLLLRHGFEQPVSALLARRGWFTLHAAAAVSPAGGACVFLGRNGAGKTTAALHACERYGYRLVTDNFTPTDGWQVCAFPGRPRLKADSAVPADSSSRALAPDPSLTAVPIEQVVFVGAGTGGNLEDLVLEHLCGEREDHRSTPLANLLRGGPVAVDEQRIAGRLLDAGVRRYDWRTGRLDDVLTAL